MAMGGMPRRGHGRRRTPMAEINVTPLVDVMLVLLIIFMVTAPLLTAGVPVNLPDSRAKPLDQQQQPVQISLDNTGKLYVDDKEVTPATFQSRLSQVPKGPDGPQIFLRADRTLDYGRVMGVMGELSRAGLTKVALVTNGEQGGDAAR
jgi:biopolymer transport protein TolR